MSRTYNTRRKKCYRFKKGTFIKKTLKCWGEDLIHRRKDRGQSRLVRARLKEKTMKEVREYEK